MNSDTGPILDMTPNGEFIRARDRESRARDYSRRGYQAPKVSFGLIFARLVGFVALIGVGLLAFWFAVFTLPFVFLCGVVLYGIYRYQLSRLGLRHHHPVRTGRSWRNR